MCRDCGEVLKCKRCDSPLTYHEPIGSEQTPSVAPTLICHTCNHHEVQPQVCPKCQSKRIRYFGAGTQKIESELATRFPSARVLRWDRDTTTTKGAHELILQKFSDHQADVLVGTQMIAKGLDLPLVTLVGVISADTSLNLPDFRATERTFQLLTQVAGRAGRGLLGGRAIIQTYTPDQYAIETAAHHDYEGFAARELDFRQLAKYPPYTRLARLLVWDKKADRAQKQAERAAEQIEAILFKRGIGARIAHRPRAVLLCQGARLLSLAHHFAPSRSGVDCARGAAGHELARGCRSDECVVRMPQPLSSRQKAVDWRGPPPISIPFLSPHHTSPYSFLLHPPRLPLTPSPPPGPFHPPTLPLRARTSTRPSRRLEPLPTTSPPAPHSISSS